MESSVPPAGDALLPPTHATFDADWGFQSPARVFANLPPKPRAWERLPRQQRQPLANASANTGRKTRTIWKRCDVRPQSVQHQQQQHNEHPQQGLPHASAKQAHPETHNAHDNAQDDMQTPDGKVVKRVRLGIGRGVAAAGKKIGAAQWDRRRSALPHKPPSIRQPKNKNQLPLETSTESFSDSWESATFPADARVDVAPDLPSVIALDSSVDLPQPILHPDGAASLETAECQPASQHIGPSGNLAEDKSVLQLKAGLNPEPIETAVPAGAKQAAGAQHLEEMRRLLSSKLSRSGRRRTDFAKPTLHTPPRQQHRRVSAAVDTLQAAIPTLLSQNSPATGDVADATRQESPQFEDNMSHGETNEPDNDVSRDVSRLEAKLTSDSAVDASLHQNPAQRYNSSPRTPIAEAVETSKSEISANEPNFTSHEDASMHVGSEEIVQEVVKAAVKDVIEVLVEENTNSDKAETTITKVELAEALLTPENASTNHDIGEAVATIQTSNVETLQSPKVAKNFNAASLVTGAGESIATDERDSPMSQTHDIVEDDLDTHAVESQDLPLETSDPEPTDTNNDGNQEETFGTPDSHENVSTMKVSLNDDDTDILKDFLSRAKASKAAKIANQSSLLSRRDSDLVKHALASPRRALDDLDGSSPSPQKRRRVMTADGGALNEEDPFIGEAQPSPTAKTFEAVDGDTFGSPDEPTDNQVLTRRSTRGSDHSNTSAKRSSASTPTPNAIALRRQDSSEPVVLKKSEAQELAVLTRTNTRRNKGGAVPARVMVLKLKGLPVDDSLMTDDSLASTEGRVRWNEELVAYFEEGKTDRLQQLGNEKTAEAAVSKPRARRAKMLGAMNGTPAKVRTKGGEFTSLLEDNTTELPAPAFGMPSNTTHALAEGQGQGQNQHQMDDPQPVAIAPKAAQDAPGRAARSLRRIPAPAKQLPPKTEAAAAEPMRTRHNSAPGQARKQQTVAAAAGKENNEAVETSAPASKDRSKFKGVAQARSGSGSASGAVAEAPKRSMVPRRGASAKK